MLSDSLKREMVENWKSHGRLYRNDMALLCEEQYPIMTTGQLVHFEPHQRAIIRECLTRDANGLFPYTTILLSEPKKSGKSAIEAMICLWLALTEPGMPEIYVLANDLDQSMGRSFTAIRQVIEAHPILSRECKIMRSKIIFPDGGFIEALPCDYSGGAGANQMLTAFDELWGYVSEASRRLWDEFTPVPTRKNSIRLIVTYAGFKKESALLWELYSRVVRKKNRIHDEYEFYADPESKTFAFWSHTPRMPWQTADYYRQQKAELRPSAYKRLHENKWVEAESVYITAEQLDALTVIRKPEPSDEYDVFIGLDAAHKRDCNAAVAVGLNGEGTFLVDYRIWKPRKGQIVMPEETLVPFAMELVADRRVRSIYYDPNHFETAAQWLKAKLGGRAVECTQTVSNLSAMASALYDAVANRRFSWYHAPELREHILNVEVRDTPGGWKMMKQTEAGKIDGAVALGMALLAAKERGRVNGVEGIRFAHQPLRPSLDLVGAEGYGFG